MLEQNQANIQVPSTLVPLVGYNILIPNACIAEVFIAKTIVPIKQSPDWCLGQTEYKGNETLVVSLERIETPGRSLSPATAIVVKIKNPPDFSSAPDFGILANKTPHIVQANNHVLDIDYMPEISHQLALSYVKIKEKQAFIPDLQKLIGQFVSYCQ